MPVCCELTQKRVGPEGSGQADLSAPWCAWDLEVVSLWPVTLVLHFTLCRPITDYLDEKMVQGLRQIHQQVCV